MVHLFHPVAVHFAIAFLVVGGCCEAWGLFKGLTDTARFGERLVLIGLFFLVPTLFTGYVAANSIEVSADAQGLLDAHERNGWIVLGAFVALQFWRGWRSGELSRREGQLYAIGLLVAVAITIYSAMLGGEMVYLNGIGVG